MLSTLTRSFTQKLRPDESSPLLSGRNTKYAQNTNQKRSFFHYRDNNRRSPPRDADNDDSDDEEDDDEELEQEDHDGRSSNDGINHTTLLPIFSSDRLNTLPVFTMTHAFREMVVDRCDTVLTWDQLRSPQVSQFLVKPIQQEIKEHYMNSATHYALIANALQFTKEASNAGNSGTDKTRAMLCELLAIKLLREATTRELIDALSYGFDPMQGQSLGDGTQQIYNRRNVQRPARISCIEVAIRAGSKRFLAHPLVVQHLQAIWNGSIVFHSAADSMHRRRPSIAGAVTYGANEQSSKAQDSAGNQRMATLYNPRDASLFKLSRLRVPRYRNILSTISFAILLLLFVAVLQEKSLVITPLELVFWAWTAGYMLDEVINFNEQGFSLYIASFWNTFDVGILILLFVHLCMRLYGIILPEDHESKHHVAKLAYDLLAATSVLLFPRLFSVLDHYRYFSQLIIAFRMMAADMIAIFLLIIIFCSGFLVALTFAFSTGDETDNPRNVAYALLQMLLGFTPAAWDRWAEYNWLGRIVLTLFLFVCHFVVVTILVTVMTNSFMEIVRNANEEHQYLFAINVISSVKSDALFAYVPPMNVLQWIFSPLRLILPFRQYLKLNRTIIKITHSPILFVIYLYERLILRPKYIDPVDLVATRGRIRRTFTERLPRFIREPSIATYRQEAALAEVFRHTTLRTARSQERRKSSNVVSHWMTTMHEDDAEPPQEEDRKIVDKLEKRRLAPRRLASSQYRDFSVSRRPTSVASDPNDLTSYADFFSPQGRIPPTMNITPSIAELPSQHTDADGDDELLTNEEDNDTQVENLSYYGHGGRSEQVGFSRADCFVSESGKQVHDLERFPSDDKIKSTSNLQASRRKDHRPRHGRNVSSATMIYNPPLNGSDLSNVPTLPQIAPGVVSQSPSSKIASGSSKRTPRKPQGRPPLPQKDNVISHSTPDLFGYLGRSKPTQIPNAGEPPRRSSLEMDLISDIGDNKAIGGGYIGAIPASFASQMLHANNAMRQSQLQLRQEEEKRRKEDNDMFGRLMMARMNTLEEGFREVVHEVRAGIKQVGSGLASRQRSPDRENDSHSQVQKRPNKRPKGRKERNDSASGPASIVSAEREGSSSLIERNDNVYEPSTPSPNIRGNIDDQELGQPGGPVQVSRDKAKAADKGGVAHPKEQGASNHETEGDKQDSSYGLM